MLTKKSKCITRIFHDQISSKPFCLDAKKNRVHVKKAKQDNSFTHSMQLSVLQATMPNASCTLTTFYVHLFFRYFLSSQTEFKIIITYADVDVIHTWLSQEVATRKLALGLKLRLETESLGGSET